MNEFTELGGARRAPINEGPYAEAAAGPHALAFKDPNADLVARLRSESNDYKDTFTWQAFQAVSISSVALGGILFVMFSQPYIGLSALAVLALALLTCRLGSYSYSSANRHYGYELFLYRIRTIPPEEYGRWKAEYADIEWEAAMRAWRVVQASLFEAIYAASDSFLVADAYRKGFDPRKRALWFSQNSLFGGAEGARWHAGSYLKRVHDMLFTVAAAADGILVATFVASFVHAKVTLSGEYASYGVVLKELLAALCCAACVGGIFVTIARARAEKAKRGMLEDGLLSIHSCAIVWQAVVVAHFSALERARRCKLTSWDLAEISRIAKKRFRREWDAWQRGLTSFEAIIDLVDSERQLPKIHDGAGLNGYTFWLGQEAASLARCADNVPGWVGVGEEHLRKAMLEKNGNRKGSRLALWRPRG